MTQEQKPAWLRLLAERPPMAAWWLRRHHCSDVVIGKKPEVKR